MRKTNRLRQARENMGLSIKQMAYLIGTDRSNISKQELGARSISKEVMLGYAIITGKPLYKLIGYRFKGLIQSISLRAYNMITELESIAQSDQKMKNTIKVLERVVENIACLKEIKDDEE